MRWTPRNLSAALLGTCFTVGVIGACVGPKDARGLFMFMTVLSIIPAACYTLVGLFPARRAGKGRKKNDPGDPKLETVVKTPHGTVFQVNTAGVIAVLVVLCAFAALVLPALPRAREEARRTACSGNLAMIGKAMCSYSNANNEFLPYDARGPLYSLCLLYPGYITDPDYFLCPSADKASQVLFPSDSALAGKPCSYGYDQDAAVSPPGSGSSRRIVAADMPGNHAAGFKVLFADGLVKWLSTPFVEDNPGDNIFARDPHLTTGPDTFIRQK